VADQCGRSDIKLTIKNHFAYSAIWSHVENFIISFTGLVQEMSDRTISILNNLRDHKSNIDTIMDSFSGQCGVPDDSFKLFKATLNEDYIYKLKKLRNIYAHKNSTGEHAKATKKAIDITEGLELFQKFKLLNSNIGLKLFKRWDEFYVCDFYESIADNLLDLIIFGSVENCFVQTGITKYSRASIEYEPISYLRARKRYFDSKECLKLVFQDRQ